MEQKATIKSRLEDNLCLYVGLAIFTGGIGIIADLLLFHYTGRGLKERFDF